MLYNWLIVFALSGFSNGVHPLFVSVTEIGHNAKSETLEISCKIFTDDFETVLRKEYNTKIDLLDVNFRSAMNPLVNEYIQKHFSVITEGKTATLKFLGFEQQEEGIVSYYEAANIAHVVKIEVINNILYEFKPQQMGIIHIMVNGQRKSRSLNNPADRASFEF
ncbi:MAG: DUF6702 family protein [Ferruginibacter sp.]